MDCKLIATLAGDEVTTVDSSGSFISMNDRVLARNAGAHIFH
jgi:hypothetical protein